MASRSTRSTPLALAALAAGAALPSLYAAAVRAVLRHNISALRDGDPGPLLATYAPDARLVFPGDHSWSGEYRGRDEIEGFLRRFLAAGLEGEPGTILVHGPPWRTVIALEFNDRALGPDGAVVYENRAVIVARTRWGRIVAEEVYEDTQRVVAFDEYLTSTGAPGAARPVAA